MKRPSNKMCPPMKLRLSSRARGSKTRISLTGTLQNALLTATQRQGLMELLGLWPTDVVVSADVRDGRWMEEWCAALDEAEVATMTFHLRPGHQRGGHHEG